MVCRESTVAKILLSAASRLASSALLALPEPEAVFLEENNKC